MQTDWTKVLEVFGSGIVGVFLVMFLLQLLTQLSTRVINAVENLGNGKGSTPDAETPAAAAKD